MNAEQRAEALLHADDRPQSLNDDLYAWSVAAAALLRTLASESQGETSPELGDSFMEILHSIHGDMPDSFADSARLAFVHALKAKPAPDAQPVAWMWQHDETGRVGFVDQWQLDNGWEKNNPSCHITRPLFDHPAPAQTPLTDEQIMALWHDKRPAAIAFARAIEAAHGIK